MRRSPFFLLLLWMPTGLWAQQDWRSVQDIVTVQERPGFLEAFGKIHAGEEDAAVVGLEQVLQDHPTDPDLYIVHYNLACAHARRGRTTEAMNSLRRAVDGGYGLQVGQIENMALDPDLASLLGLPGYAALKTEAGARLLALAEGWQSDLQPEVYAPPRGPESADQPWPVLILLHGYASSQEEILEQFRPFADQHGFLLMAPSSTHLISPQRWGWYVDLLEFIDYYRRDCRNVWLGFQKVKQQYDLDPSRVLVVGHGQGAALGFALVSRNPQWIRGGVMLGGGYAPSVLNGWIKAASWWGRRIRLLHGTGDQLFPVEDLPAFQEICEAHGLPVSLATFEGGHELPEDLAARLAEALTWVEEVPFARETPPKDLMESVDVVLPPVPDKEAGEDGR